VRGWAVATGTWTARAGRRLLARVPGRPGRRDVHDVHDVLIVPAETPDAAELAPVAAHTGNGAGATERGAGPRGDEFGRPDVPFGDGWWN
jgi:hypothetical protein